jgi:hypothetical protein
VFACFLARSIVESGDHLKNLRLAGTTKLCERSIGRRVVLQQIRFLKRRWEYDALQPACNGVWRGCAAAESAQELVGSADGAVESGLDSPPEPGLDMGVIR